MARLAIGLLIGCVVLHSGASQAAEAPSSTEMRGAIDILSLILAREFEIPDAPNDLDTEQEVAREQALLEMLAANVNRSLDSLLADTPRVVAEVRAAARREKAKTKKKDEYTGPDFHKVGAPGAYLLNRGGYPDTEYAVAVAVHEVRADLQRLLACAGTGALDAPDEVCRSFVPLCRRADFDADGRVLSRRVIDEELQVHRGSLEVFRGPDPAKLTELVPGVAYDFVQVLACRLWGRRGGVFQSEFIAASDEPAWVTERIETFADCDERSAMEETTRTLDNVITRENVKRGAPIRWQGMARRRLTWCREATARNCARVYRIGGTFAIAYINKGCVVRKVTANDIRNDVEEVKGTWTEAEQLEHLQIAERIETCAALAGRGWEWTFNDGTKDAASCKAQQRGPQKGRGAATRPAKAPGSGASDLQI